MVAEVDDWEQLREAGSALKDRVLRHLDEHLVALEERVRDGGGVVHWARDGGEANAIVTRLVAESGARAVVKAKSLTTEETRLNVALERRGHRGHRDRPRRADHPARPRHPLPCARAGDPPQPRRGARAVRPPPRGGAGPLTDDPRELAEVARRHLRARFLDARVGITGANFAVAETGTIALVESEGNGRMCSTLPQLLITVMGIEKLIPTWQDLEVYLQLLPRSSTAERMNPYTSLWTGVTPGDGPSAFHLVLLDNGRTNVLADALGRQALRCIRCSACMNVCPVYERTGGHAYGSVYPGPIGAILAPQLAGLERRRRFPTRRPCAGPATTPAR